MFPSDRQSPLPSNREVPKTVRVTACAFRSIRWTRAGTLNFRPSYFLFPFLPLPSFSVASLPSSSYPFLPLPSPSFPFLPPSSSFYSPSFLFLFLFLHLLFLLLFPFLFPFPFFLFRPLPSTRRTPRRFHSDRIIGLLQGRRGRALRLTMLKKWLRFEICQENGLTATIKKLSL